MKQLYLCGAITKNPNYKQDFEEARTRLVKAGYTAVINPIEFCNQSWEWKECMRKCLTVLCRHKYLGIAKIETPYPSKGQELELQIADALGYEIKTVYEWVETGK